MLSKNALHEWMGRKQSSEQGAAYTGSRSLAVARWVDPQAARPPAWLHLSCLPGSSASSLGIACGALSKATGK